MCCRFGAYVQLDPAASRGENRATRRGALQERAAVAATTILVYGQANEKNRDQGKKERNGFYVLVFVLAESSCYGLSGAAKNRAKEAARQVPNAQILELILSKIHFPNLTKMYSEI